MENTPPQYFIHSEDKLIGPLNLDEIKAYPSLSSETIIWLNNQNGWKRAKDIEELQPYLFDMPPPLPSLINIPPPPGIEKESYLYEAQEKKYQSNSKYIITWGIILVISGIPLLYFAGMGSLLIMLGIALLCYSPYPLIFGANEIYYEKSALHGIQKIHYTHISHIEYHAKEIVIYYSYSKKIKIHFNTLKESDWSNIVAHLKSRCP